jgi:hypothetical protein
LRRHDFVEQEAGDTHVLITPPATLTELEIATPAEAAAEAKLLHMYVPILVPAYTYSIKQSILKLVVHIIDSVLKLLLR